MSVFSKMKMGHDWVLGAINEHLEYTRPARIVFVTSGLSILLTYLYFQMNDKVSFRDRLMRSFWSMIRRLPMVKHKIQHESEKVRLMFEKELLTACQGVDTVLELPHHGWSQDKVLQITEDYLQLGDQDWKLGCQSGTVYHASAELTELMTKVYGMAVWSNPLHPDAFPGVRKMEAEIVKMCCHLFNGGPQSCGCVTSGGTESIILACKAYRDYAIHVKGIRYPVMVVPSTAHAAFDKAASLLDMGIVHVPVDPDTHRVSVKRVRKAITGSTCMLVASAPDFAYGSIDDIEALGQLALSYDIPLHVDACLGGFLIAFMKEAGYYVKPFDFRVPGVTSMSADTHKYGYSPKGSSVVLYSEPVYRHYQWFCSPDWPGGMYATCTLSGSRAGGIIATTWAALTFFGRSGYVDCTKKVIRTTRFIEQELRKMVGIQVLGSPDVSVVAFGSSSFNIFGLFDLLKTKNWSLCALQFPDAIHLCVTMLHTQPGVAERFINDVKTCLAQCMADPASCEGGSAAMYGMTQSIPDRTLVGQICWSYLDALYVIADPTKTSS